MANYFSHDYKSRADKKIVLLTMKHGWAGYGVYWCIVEMLYEEEGYLMLSECDRIAHELRVDVDVVCSIINDFDLFKNDGEKFWSESGINRLKLIIEKSQKASVSASKRWDKYYRNANAKQTHIERNAIKKRKEKKIKVNIESASPSLEEFKNYFKENGFKAEVAERAWKGYDVAGWHDSKGNKVKNWKQKCQNVWFKDENKSKENKQSTPRNYKGVADMNQIPNDKAE